MSDAPAQAVDPGPPTMTSSLPWNQIPRFDPSTTDLRVYEQKMRFIHSIWPQEFIEHLAPRAALLIEGAAFQKICRIDVTKLRTKDGVKILIEALGGQWGRTPEEDVLDLFERALYMTCQKGDESNDSYLARHDIAFEDLISRNVSISDIRAYVLLRQSALQSEDRKKIIMDNQGKLTYDVARKSMRLLGSKFFQDLQNHGKSTAPKKTYEAYQMDDHDEVHMTTGWDHDPEVDEDTAFQVLADQGDEDAIFVADFEDQVVEALQEHEGLSSCFVSYQEARARVRERARARGFWPVTKGKGKGKTKKGKFNSPGVPVSSSGSSSFGRRRSLADRIANSTCRACGMPGHWKRECPNRPDSKKPAETINIMDEIHMYNDENENNHDTGEIIDELPVGTTSWQDMGPKFVCQGTCDFSGCVDYGCDDVFVVCVNDGIKKVTKSMKSRLMDCCRKHGIDVVAQPSVCSETPDTSAGPEVTNPVISSSEDHSSVFQFEEESHEAIIDTGASRAVIGSDRLPGLLESTGMASCVKVAPSNVVFRFGNSGTLQSTQAVFFPRKTGGWIRVEVVPGHTPFLLSNSLLRSLKAVIDIDGKMVWFKGCHYGVPLKTCRKNLMGVDFAKILNIHGHEGETQEIHAMTHDPTTGDMHGNGNLSEHDADEDGRPREFHDPTNESDVRNDDVASFPWFPKTKDDVQLSSLVGKPHVNEITTKIGRAISSDQSEPNANQSCDNLESHGSAVEVSNQPRPQEQGWFSQHGGSGHPTTSGCGNPSRVGSDRHSFGEACRKDDDGGLPRPRLCPSDLEPQGSVIMGQELSDVQPSHEEFPDRQGISKFVVSGTSGSGVSQGQKSTPAENTGVGRVGEGRDDSRTTGHERSKDIRSDHRTRKEGSEDVTEDRPEAGGSEDADRDQPRSSSRAEGPDRHFAARSSCRSGSSARSGGPVDELTATARYIESDQPLCHLSESEERMIHHEVARKIAEVEDGLSKLTYGYAFLNDVFSGLSSSKGILNEDVQSLSSTNHTRMRESPKMPTLLTHHVNEKQHGKLDFLEVYCSPDSKLTDQVIRRGGRARRFSKSDGDLNTEDGIRKLWLWIYMFEPRHIWMAPECKLYGKFSMLNMSKGLYIHDHVMNERRNNRHHLHLCNDFFLHQTSCRRHAHLEQPADSVMTRQDELWDLEHGTFKTVFDMCRVGGLRLPNFGKYLKKRTCVHTTSGYFDHHLNQRFCTKNHEHEVIQGTTKIHGKRMNVSAYAAAYTSRFGSFVAQVLLEECVLKENPIDLDAMTIFPDIANVVYGEHERPSMAPGDLPCPKRLRYDGKRPPRGPEDMPKGDSTYGKAPTWETVIKGVSSKIPRVGNYVIQGDRECAEFQMLVPEFHVKMILICRGTERYRVPGNLVPKESIPWRKTILVDRDSGAVVDTGPPEQWLKLSKVQQTRKAGSARISISIFGSDHQSFSAGIPMDEAKEPNYNEGEIVGKGVSPECPMDLDGDGECEVPRTVPQSGPKFMSLSSSQKTDLRRLHCNLGHPSPEKLARLLEEQGAKAEVVQAARDFQCDTCVETQGPKLSTPATIHPPRDFNDCVGCDGAYWTSSLGKTYHFMHYIDEATLFHVGAPSGRTVEEQIATFENTWLNWAGPCKLLYMDPAGEYVNDKWHDFLQRESIKCSMSAGASHWQIGRVEAHGRVVKNMLDSMDRDCKIEDGNQFATVLRHVFMAKNSLSCVNGYSPEQAVLGKAKPLPGSLLSDTSASTHSLAESECPEGIKFRESLMLRENARRAFLSADNDRSLRRALLRRSRREAYHYEKGDWVLYWRTRKGNMKSDRGRWHGPGQVVVNEGNKVVWISHGGYLIRASPQQIRPASLREFRGVTRDAGGIVEPRVDSRCKRFVSLDSIPDEVTTRPSSDPPHVNADFPPSVDSQSQPDGEVFPSDPSSVPYSPTSVVPSSAIPSDNEIPGGPEVSMDGADVPIPEDEDDALFGDDLPVSYNGSGYWSFEADSDGFDSVLLTTGARKQKVEVQWNQLNDGEKLLFEKAKAKEVQAWVDHKTVCRMAGGSLRDDQVMRCRWILTWKPPAPGTTEKRPKARLVIRGFEDPDLTTIAADAPTLSKDGKQLVLQMVASSGWRLINFDISTAFLKGQSDGRKLGIHAPIELQKAIGLKPGEQCGLLGGAYGRADAPILWYKTLRKTLEDLGFVASPFDGCVFTLVTQDSQGFPKVRGCLGLHVDDGLGGGDEYFSGLIGKLRERFDFGAYNEGEFEFCGVKYYQWDDGSIEMGQDSYIQKISPIYIPRSRRQEGKAALTAMETQSLRQICGSLQYAAVHTRPDLAAKVGELQSAIPKGRVEHLVMANRVLHEAKSRAVNLMIVPIKRQHVTFCAFSDASFETADGRSSRQGTIIFTTDGNMQKNVRTVICPMAWSSRKIPRVVRSTLSAESVALGATLDRLSWLRVFWEWIKDPSIDWSEPSEILNRSPGAVVATDCKSVYDIATKTSTPTCTEYRTTLECLLIRERLQENCKLRWVNSKAMLADCLTKSMDGEALRKVLQFGKYSLYDEHQVLQQRADKRAQLKWISEGQRDEKDVDS